MEEHAAGPRRSRAAVCGGVAEAVNLQIPQPVLGESLVGSTDLAADFVVAVCIADRELGASVPLGASAAESTAPPEHTAGHIAAAELDSDTVFGELTDELQQVIGSALRRDLRRDGQKYPDDNQTTTNVFERSTSAAGRSIPAAAAATTTTTTTRWEIKTGSPGGVVNLDEELGGPMDVNTPPTTTAR